MISKEDYDLMRKGICPNCHQPMIRNGKRTHSRTKAIICEEKFREKSQVPHQEQKINVDGKLYDVDANYRQR